MGKAGKKIKSEKLNSLRKQYDAFLEDDKKRKDRNEYILGRLEEMRSSTALMKTNFKDKPNIFEQRMRFQKIPNYLSNPLRIDDKAKYFQTQTNISVDYPKEIEVSIIREITKNYILIPKVQSFLPSNRSYNEDKTSEIADTDWKSKYNILNELKQNEKESVNDDHIKESVDSAMPAKISQSMQENKINDNIPLDNNNINNYEVPFTSNSNTVIDKTIVKELLEPTPDHKQKTEDNVVRKELQQNSTNIPNQNLVIEEPVQNEVIKPNLKDDLNEELNKDNQNYNAHYEFKNIDSKTLENQELLSQYNYSNEAVNDQNSPEEYIEPNNETNEIVTIQTLDVQELKNDDNMITSEFVEDNHEEHVENEANIDDTPEYASNEEILNDPQNANTEMNELEKEQNEMFYTENPEKNYEYNQNNVDEQQLAYVADNENYTNEQYSYYNESQQQQPYPTEINEHIESTEQYDPNYQQQYAESYDNAPQYDSQYQEQYQTDNPYEQQQGQVFEGENYGELQANNQNFEPLQTEVTDTYQTQQENVYTLENQVVDNQNYESQQYVTDEQNGYLNEVPTEQYGVQEEQLQMHTEHEVIKNTEKELDMEDGYIENQNADITGNAIDPNVPVNIPVEKESSVKA